MKKPLSILFVATADVTFENGYRVRIVSEVRSLLREGVKVQVLSFLHIRELIQGFPGSLKLGRMLRETGSSVQYVPVFPDFKTSLLLWLTAKYKQFILSSYVAMHDVSLIHCHGHGAAFVAVGARPSRSIPIVFDMHGAVPEEVEADDLLPSVRQKMFERAEKMERYAIEGVDAVISVSQALQSHWQSKYPSVHPKTLVIPCAVDSEIFNCDFVSRAQLRKRWGIPDQAPILVYSGALQPYQCINQIIAVASELIVIDPTTKMLFLIPPHHRVELERILDESNLPQEAYIIESVGHDNVSRYLSAADVGFLLRTDDIFNKVAFPTKFAEYLSCGLPVIATPYVDAVREAIELDHVGIVLKSYREDEVVRLRAFVHSVMMNRDEWRGRCRSAAENKFAWNLFGSKIKELYMDIAGENI